MKYKLTDKTIQFNGRTLYQIQALIDIPKYSIKAGDLGGYIEKEANLSQDNNAWVYGIARMSGNAQVSGGAWVSGNAQVYGNARVYGDAQVSGDALIYGDAQVYGDARVYGDAQVYGGAKVYGYAQVYGNALVYGNAQVESKLDLVYIQAPRYDLTLTNSGLSIGCECYSIEHWLSNYAEIGKKHGFTEKEIEHYLKLIKTVNKIYKAQQELKGLKMSTFPGTCVKCDTRLRWSDSKEDYVCHCIDNIKPTLNIKKFKSEPVEEYYYIESGFTVNNEPMYKRVRK